MQCNWGILGPGYVATRAVIPAIQHVSNAHILAIASSNKERAQTASNQFSIERTYNGYQALLDDPDIHAVYISLPNHLHREWTIRAAQAGKHILCEKPLAMNASECDEMIAVCQDAHVLLMEAVMYRFHPRIIHLKRMLTANELGDLRFLHAAFSFPFNASDNYRAYPEFGGGALLDVGSYCVNAARWLIGSEPQDIQAHIAYRRKLDVSTSAMLHFEGDVFAHIQCSFAAAEHQVIEVVGSTGVVTAPLAFTAWREDSTVLMVQRGAAFDRIEFAPADPYQAMAAHFTDCVLGQASLLFPPRDGHATVSIVDTLKDVAKKVS